MAVGAGWSYSFTLVALVPRGSVEKRARTGVPGDLWGARYSVAANLNRPDPSFENGGLFVGVQS